MGLALSVANYCVAHFTNTEAVLLEIPLGILVYGLTVVAMDAGRVQVLLALVAPRFKKSIKTA
jgi:uncharacterized RDD family membrane protein YckC